MAKDKTVKGAVNDSVKGPLNIAETQPVKKPTPSVE